MAIKDLQALTPGFNWEHFYPASGSPHFAEINVAEPEFLKGMNQVIGETEFIPLPPDPPKAAPAV